MTPLQRLQARIDELEKARAEIQRTLDGIPSPAPIAPPTDWEARLSAARAVDALLGSDTASAVEAQRQAERLALEKQARQAAQNALQRARADEAMVALTRDLEAATGLLERSASDAARARLPDCESRYHRARDAAMAAALDWAGWLSLCGRETEAHQLLRSIGTTGDTMTALARKANALRQQLLDEEETDHA